jgi:hypothetical protein
MVVQRHHHAHVAQAKAAAQQHLVAVREFAAAAGSARRMILYGRALSIPDRYRRRGWRPIRLTYINTDISIIIDRI